MAREKKPIGVRPVEEETFLEQEIVRLEKDTTVVKLLKERVEVRPPPDARLEVPEVSEMDAKRTHEPGVEVLYEGESAQLNSDELEWGRTEAARRPLPWGWFALLGLLLVGAVAWSVTRMVDAGREVEAVKQQAEIKVSEDEATDQEIERSLAQMERVVRSFCLATSVDEMAGMVRHSARVRPLMERYYAENPLVPLGYQRQKDFQGAMLGTENNFWVVRVVVGNGKTKVLLVEEDGGRFLVDWETVVTYQPMDWDSYALDRPQGTTLDFRVRAQPDNLFSHEFVNQEKWSCYLLTAPASEEFLWGYAAKNSEADSILQALLRDNTSSHKPVSVILRLGLPQEMRSRRGVIIEKVLSSRWAYVVPPDTKP